MAPPALVRPPPPHGEGAARPAVLPLTALQKSPSVPWLWIAPPCAWPNTPVLPSPLRNVMRYTLSSAPGAMSNTRSMPPASMAVAPAAPPSTKSVPAANTSRSPSSGLSGAPDGVARVRRYVCSDSCTKSNPGLASAAMIASRSEQSFVAHPSGSGSSTRVGVKPALSAAGALPARLTNITASSALTWAGRLHLHDSDRMALSDGRISAIASTHGDSFRAYRGGIDWSTLFCGAC